MMSDPRPKPPPERWEPFAALLGCWLLSIALMEGLLRTPFPHQVFVGVLADDTIRLLSSAGVAYACFWRSRHAPESLAGVWRAYGWAMVWWSLSTLYLILSVDLLALGAPWRTFRHLGYLLTYGFITAGLLALPMKGGLPTQRIQALLDGVMIAAALFFVAWGGALKSLVLHSRAANAPYVWTLVYPIASLALTSVWLFQEARVSGVGQVGPRVMMRLALLTWVVSDLLVSVLSISGQYRQFGVGERLDYIRAASIVGVGLGALWPRSEGAYQSSARRHAGFDRILPFIPALLAMGFGVGLLLLNRPMDPVMVGSGTILGLVLMIRQYLAVRDLEALSEGLEQRVEARTRELRGKQQELLRTQRMQLVASMAAGLAHDFKNQLGVILSWSDLMKEHPRLPEDLVHATDSIQGATHQADRLIQQVLGAGRQQELHPESFELHPFLVELRPSLEAVLRGRAILKLEPAPGPLEVHMDPEQLQQVLLNLVSNAGDAMKGKGTVQLRAWGDPLEPFVNLDVADDGAGISLELQERIFEPFFTTKAPGQGTGLGLASVQGVLWQSGGAISLRSELGKGTTFTLRLPVAP